MLLDYEIVLLVFRLLSEQIRCSNWGPCLILHELLVFSEVVVLLLEVVGRAAVAEEVEVENALLTSSSHRSCTRPGLL